MADKVQSYANHAQVIPMYHYVTFGLAPAHVHRRLREPVSVVGRSLHAFTARRCS